MARPTTREAIVDRYAPDGYVDVPTEDPEGDIDTVPVVTLTKPNKQRAWYWALLESAFLTIVEILIRRTTK